MKYFLLIILTILTLQAEEPITPLPLHIKTNPAKVALGKALFSDPILSYDGTISCASCHNLLEGGDDAKVFSTGIKNLEGNINSPTVFNAVFNFSQFWDGRAKNLQEQATGPIENPVEMGNSFKNVIKILTASHYKATFDALYEEGITKESITDAIAEFEKTLITPDSPFDNYLRGDQNAISKKQKEGYQLFKEKGCIACHHGQNVGGNMYNKFGLLISIKDDNLGRFNVTKNENDKQVFKVPSLRNVAKTAPYFHNGSASNLKKAVYFMAKYQVGRPISEDEVNKIVSFLEALTGKLPKNVKE
jgi:cytochrome c peroxidase